MGRFAAIVNGSFYGSIIRIKKMRVVGEDLGFAARRAKIHDDDLNGLVVLARCTA